MTEYCVDRAKKTYPCRMCGNRIMKGDKILAERDTYFGLSRRRTECKTCGTKILQDIIKEARDTLKELRWFK